MVYSMLLIFIGITVLFFAFKLRKRDKNLWDTSTTIKGLLGGFILIVIGVLTLFKGWS